MKYMQTGKLVSDLALQMGDTATCVDCGSKEKLERHGDFLLCETCVGINEECLGIHDAAELLDAARMFEPNLTEQDNQPA